MTERIFRSRSIANEPMHVVAGVIADIRGRILLARRTAGRDLAGAWEFPGGKLEVGETPLQALRRELQEELGIVIDSAEPLIAVPQVYPDKRLLLDVYRVTAFRGVPRGREKQALAWVPPEKLARYPMPPADQPVVAALNQSTNYLITPEPDLDLGRFVRQLEHALAQGVGRVQLRSQHPERSHIRRCAEAAKACCEAQRVELLINNDIELAVSLGCGLHLRAAQLMTLRERPLPAVQTVAASCHNAEELRQAQALALDFAVLGPVAATASHAERAPLGWPGFAQLREQVSLPIYALGGLQRSDFPSARRHGAQGIAAIRGLWPAFHG